MASLDIFKHVTVINQSHLHHSHDTSPKTGESHYLIQVQLKKECNLSLMTIHRKINQLLESEFQNGLHSVSIERIKS